MNFGKCSITGGGSNRSALPVERPQRQIGHQAATAGGSTCRDVARNQDDSRQRRRVVSARKSVVPDRAAAEAGLIDAVSYRRRRRQRA